MPKRVAVIGADTIDASWAARFRLTSLPSDFYSSFKAGPRLLPSYLKSRYSLGKYCLCKSSIIS